MGRLLAAVLAAAIGIAPSVRGAELSADEAEALAMLHDGRFSEARDLLSPRPGVQAVIRQDFLLTFVTYWRLIYDEDNEPLRREFESQLTALLERIEEPPDGRRATSDDLVWAGTGHLFLAQLRAMQKKPFAAAFEAKKAKRHLEAASEDGAGVDPLFGLGAYNYMADRVSGFIKGLRALLALPGGNRELGLRQLERAAAESRIFALEARLLLVTVYASKHERRFEDALAEIAKAKEMAPERLTTLHAEARCLLALGRFDAVARIVARALERAASLTAVEPSVVATFESLGARAEFGRLRVDRARRQAESALARPTVPLDLRPGLEAIVEQSRAIEASAAWRSILPSLEAESRGDLPEASDSAVSAASASPEDPVPAFVAGRALLREGKAGAALPYLASAERSSRLPASWQGWCRILAGRAADRLGERERALRYYRSAASMHGFAGRDAAQWCQTRPCGAEE